MKAILVTAALALALAPSATAGRSGVAAELQVYPRAVAPTEAPRVVLVNTGGRSFTYGYGYKLERQTQDGWRWINRNQAVPLVLLFLKAGESSRPERIGIWRTNPEFERCPRSEPCCLRVVLRPGLYRVSKGVSFGERHLIARATFRVLDKPTGTAE